jgi:hypothetical protein
MFLLSSRITSGIDDLFFKKRVLFEDIFIETAVICHIITS